jgi:rhamnulose-1-phosphate aldolase/alcohol dehydrogenase
VKSRWSDAEAGSTPLDQLVYMSRIMGQDEGLVLWGGGNTSVKVDDTDLLGRPVELMLIKGSGSDMKDALPKHFPAVRLAEIRASFDTEEMTDEEMVAYLGRCMVDPAAPRPSIETLLHGYLDARAIAHSHADAILALTNTKAGADLVADALGANVAIVAYRRPGFRLAKEVARAVRAQPGARAVVLMNHGLITWGDTAREAYERHIEYVTRAEEVVTANANGHSVPGASTPHTLPREQARSTAALVAPILRAAVSERGHKILRFDDAPDVLEFASAERVAELAARGAVTPDHMLNTKRQACVVQPSNLGDPASIAEAIRRDVTRYVEDAVAHHERFRTDEPLLDPAPRVVLVPGLGMWTVGRNMRACVIPADIYHHTMQVMRGAEAVDTYATLDDRESFDAEYWPLELYKLTLAPPEKELAGRICLVTGAARGIGAAIARRLGAEGAHVVVTDVDDDGARGVANEIVRTQGAGRAIGGYLDVTSERSVQDAFELARLTYGGLDVLVSNAGIAHVAPIDELELIDWERSLAINATGHFLVAREALRIFKAQDMGGAMVFVATKNVTAPGKDFGAYSAAKAAEAQLARVLAIEGGPFGVRVNMVNPDAIFEGSGLWSDDVRQQRATSYGIGVDELEEHYRKRNLLQAKVTADDVAEAAFWLASDRSAKTTGAMIPVDGGVREAFPR